MWRSRKRSRELPGEDLELVEDFGEIVRKARMSLGLTQEELAKQIGEKSTVIKKIEANELKPSIALAKKLEKFLKITLLVPAEESPGDLERYFLSKGKPASSGISLGDLLKKKQK
ncbi:MAG: TIGR00270 family protein [Thaumarchaeota archaeon]|nr:TIGR00270 family protein [Nitrososphaerota archaeon]